MGRARHLGLTRFLSQSALMSMSTSRRKPQSPCSSSGQPGPRSHAAAIFCHRTPAESAFKSEASNNGRSSGSRSMRLWFDVICLRFLSFVRWPIRVRVVAPSMRRGEEFEACIGSESRARPHVAALFDPSYWRGDDVADVGLAWRVPTGRSIGVCVAARCQAGTLRKRRVPDSMAAAKRIAVRPNAAARAWPMHRRRPAGRSATAVRGTAPAGTRRCPASPPGRRRPS